MHPDEVQTQSRAQRVVLHTMSARDQGVSVVELSEALNRSNTVCLDIANAAVKEQRVVVASIGGTYRFYATQAQADAHAALLHEPVSRKAAPAPAPAHTPFSIAGPRIFSGAMGRGFEPTNASGFAPRLGQDDFKQWPSRRGNLRYYRDGRVEAV